MLKALLVLVVVSCVVATNFSAATQQAIVDRHNLYRANSNLNPQANPVVPSVTWDSSLAAYANNWVSACNFAHGSNNPNGENLYSSYSSSGYPGDSAGVPAVDSWNSEKPYYNYASGTCVGGECLHFTQVVWSATLRIGCAYANCPSFGTFVACEYSPRGNFNMQTTKAWPTSGGGSSCTPSCPSGQCGLVSSCGSQVSCPACPSGTYCPGNGASCTACTNPCTSGVCGLRYSSTCPTTQYDCGSCSSGFSCVSNTCQASTPACTSSICTANGRNCGSFTDPSCTGSVSCGTCSSGQTCTNGVCVAPPCNGACSSPSQTCNTASNTCACSSGYTLTNGVCTANSNINPVWTADFVSLSGGASTSYPDSSTLIISGTSTTPSVLNFARSNAAYNLAWTKATAEVTQTAGSFGFGWRIGNRASYADDGVYVYATNIGLSNYGMNYDWKYYGGWQNPAPNPYTFSSNNWRTNGPMTVASWLVTNTTSGYSNIYMSTGYSETVNGYTTSRSASYYVTVPTQYLGSIPGTVALYSKRTGSANSVVSRFTLATSTTLSVSLYNCISDADWVTLFRSLTGCSSCTVTARASGTNGRCKAAGAGKEAASAFIVVVESTGVAADAIVTNFLAAVESGSAAAAPLAVKSASIIGGMEGAALAGFPEGAGVITTAPATGAGGGGGGAAGLSGGAIAGIVIGSVGGAVLILGVAAIVVAAVVVAAVVVAKKSGDSDSDSAPSRADPEVNKRGSIRNTIYNIFRGPRGGVDVMNNPNGHQSITARAPKMM